MTLYTLDDASRTMAKNIKHPDRQGFRTDVNLPRNN